MFLFHGKRKIRIKKYLDTKEQCKMCKSIAFRFNIIAEYYHLQFIPFLPTGEKEVDVKCTNCGYGVCSGASKNHYLSITRNPFYLYSGPLLIIALIAALVLKIRSDEKEEAMYIAAPKIGDVYRMCSKQHDSTCYYFRRVARVSQDSVFVYPNSLLYLRFTSMFDNSDYFINKEIPYSKDALKQLYESGKIDGVNRDYEDYEGFNRIRPFTELK